MIISASRRTDIPAFYPEWFMNRLREKTVMVPNPYNRRRITRIRLSPDTVDCIVFWTKNPEPLIPYLKEIDNMGYRYCFQMTITDYEEDLEPGVPCTEDSIATFLLLSEMIGPERIDWRFDPVLLSEKYSLAYHEERFDTMCQWLHTATGRCIISFIDAYREARYPELEAEQIEKAAASLSKVAQKYRLPLYTCAEKTDLSSYGIGHGACIDKDRIKNVTGYKLDVKKDTGQRPQCMCAQSIDIGMYDTCIGGCKYCYATGGADNVKKRYGQHDPLSPLLSGRPKGDEVIVEKTLHSNMDCQISLFDLPEMGLNF